MHMPNGHIFPITIHRPSFLHHPSTGIGHRNKRGKGIAGLQ
jgi:hypothetical protein